MKNTTTTTVQSVVIMDESTLITIQEICQSTHTHAELIIELVEHGIIEPIGPTPTEWQFPATALTRTQAALRLQEDLGVNLPGAALALDLLDELRELRERLAVLERE